MGMGGWGNSLKTWRKIHRVGADHEEEKEGIHEGKEKGESGFE